MKNLTSIFTFILAFAFTANAQLGVPSSYKDTATVSDSAKMIWQVPNATGNRWVPAKIRSMNFANLAREVSDAFDSACALACQTAIHDSIQNLEAASSAQRVGALVLGSAKDTMHWVGNSYCEAGEVFVTENQIFNPKYGFIGKNQCNGSGIGVTNITFSGTIYANNVSKGYLSAMEPAINDMVNGLNRDDYYRVLSAGVAWYSFPTAWKSRYDSATYAGVWTSDSDLVSGMRPYKRTNALNATVTFPCRGTACIFGTMLTYPNGGTFSVSVDGVLVDTLTSQLHGVGWNGSSLAPAAYVIKNLSAGNHTIILKNLGTDRIYFNWWNNGLLGYAPTVVGLYAPTPIPQGNGYYASVDTFKVIHAAIAADLALVGAPNVRTVSANLDTAVASGDFRDNVHPSLQGAIKRADSLYYAYSNGTVQQGLDLAAFGNFVHAGDSADLHGLTVRGATTVFTTLQSAAGNPYVEGTGADGNGANVSVFNPTRSANAPAYMSVTAHEDNGGNAFYNMSIFGVTGWSMGIDNQTAGNPFRICSIVSLAGGCVLTATSTSITTEVKLVGLDTIRAPYGNFTTNLKTPLITATTGNFGAADVSGAFFLSGKSVGRVLVTDVGGEVVASLGTALQILGTNSGATGTQWVTSSGTGNILRGTVPSIAGMGFSGAMTCTGTCDIQSGIWRFLGQTRWEGGTMSFNTAISNTEGFLMGGNPTVSATTQRSMTLNQAFTTGATATIAQFRIEGSSTGSYTTSGDVTSVQVAAFTKGASHTISGNYIGLDIASVTATVGGTAFALRTGAVGAIRLGALAGTGTRTVVADANGTLSAP